LFAERKQIAICAAAVALVGGFVVFRYMPLHARIKDIKEAKAVELLAVSKGLAQSKQLPVLEEQLELLAESVGDYEAKIPRDRELGAFLQTIAELMKQHNLREQVIAPGEQIPAGKLRCIPVEMRCRGTLGELYAFFKGLRGLERLIRIERLRLTNDAAFSGEVTMETRAVIYYAPQVEEG